MGRYPSNLTPDRTYGALTPPVTGALPAGASRRQRVRVHRVVSPRFPRDEVCAAAEQLKA